MAVARKRVSWVVGSTFLLTVAAVLLGVTGGAAQETHDVEVVDFAFVPAVVEIEAGDTVVWSQTGSEPHDILAEDGTFNSHPECNFGAGDCMQQGDTFEWTSTEPGEIPYYCTLHGSPGGNGMAGTIVVVEPSGPDPGMVAGTVADAATDEPIEGATITADGASATTDASGDYTIEGLEPGEYTVTAEADGYASASQTATVEEGATTTVDFALNAVPPPVPVGLELVAEGLSAPVQALSPPDDSGRLFIVDQAGLIRVVSPEGTLLEEPFLDLRDRMVAFRDGFDERGALGLAFHPDYATNGRLFVYYSAPLRPEGPEGWDHTAHISEFAVSEDPDVADPDSERIVLQVDEPQFNHNGGQVMFGPDDGYLYISLGDGGGGNDVGTGHTPDLGNAQDITNLLGSILRIDVDGAEPYESPADNPFVGVEGRDEIFAYGLRNPYRFSFDQGGDHDLLAGDAGQALWEEVSLITNGGNYGWNIKEGTHCFDPDNPNVTPEDCPDTGPHGEPLIDPVIEYPNIRQPGGIGTVVVGGYVYRGNDVPQLQGQYVFGDWSASFGEPDGTLLVAEPGTEGLWPIRELEVVDRPDGRLGHYLLGFGQDAAGEVYVLASDSAHPSGDTGKVYRLTSGAGSGTVAGTVTDADGGDPIAGATVTADGESATTTDASGDYTIDGLAPGDYTVTATAEGYEPAMETATVSEGETATVDFALDAVVVDPDPGAISGTVTDADGGDPIAGATVTADGQTATTDASGDYTIDGLAPGDYTVTATAEGYEPATQTATVTAGATTTVDFALDAVAVEPGAITGTVTDADGGDPIAGATVTADGESATTDASGDYTIDGLEPGEYTVTATAEGYETAMETATVSEGATTTVDFALDAVAVEPGAITGTVTDADGGDPIAGATVTADGESATTDASGDYTIDGLAPGDYTVTATAEGYDSATETATVSEGATATVDFALDAIDPGPGQACPPGAVDTADFTDRDEIPAVHRDNVDCASFREIVEGFADGSFGPTLPVRRDQMAAFIARTLDAADVDLPAAATDRFTDVAPGSTHDDAIHRLAAAGIVLGGPEGLPATSFGPGLQVRRDQMASFLIRAAEFAGDQQLASQDQAFTDVPPGNAHFANVNGAAELGLAQGFGDGTYRPASNVRRDQMTTFVIRLLTHLMPE